jgi:hypothetical protein
VVEVLVVVLLRLIDPNGRPGVKIGRSADGGGMSLAGDCEKRECNGAQIPAKAEGISVVLTNKDGKTQVVKPWSRFRSAKEDDAAVGALSRQKGLPWCRGDLDQRRAERSDAAACA